MDAIALRHFSRDKQEMIDFEHLTPISEIDRGDPGDKGSIGAYYERARKFLLSFDWCRNIKCSYLGMGYEGILAVFLFQIEADREDVDEYLWVITGDVPSAYLVCDNSPRAPEALEGYVEEMRRWVLAVRANASTEDIIPVNAPETEEYASMLESRLAFIESKILSKYDLSP